MPVFTEPISDETAYALAEMLNWLSMTFENTYYAQIRRHITNLDQQPVNPEQPWRKP